MSLPGFPKGSMPYFFSGAAVGILDQIIEDVFLDLLDDVPPHQGFPVVATVLGLSL